MSAKVALQPHDYSSECSRSQVRRGATVEATLPIAMRGQHLKALGSFELNGRWSIRIVQ